MKTVLLTNGQQTKTLAAARSLGSRGINIISAEETRFNPTAFSKYSKKSLVYPSPKKYPDKFYKWLCDTIVKYKCDILFPMDDDVLQIVMDNYDEVSKLCKIPVARIEDYNVTCDKGETAELAQYAGIDMPETHIIKSMDELEEKAKQIVYPAIIKPRKSSGSRGMRTVNDEDELIKNYKEVHKDYPYPIIQEYIGVGLKYDCCVLYDEKSKLKAYFIQRELRGFPIKHGPSTVQESLYSSEILEKTLKIMDKLKWYGVADVEYMTDPRTGKLKFMEINPRFWASVQAAISSGIDFPWLLYRIATEVDIEEHFGYKEGVRCRSILPGDILHFIYSKDRKNMDPPFFSRGIKDTIISKEDPLPTMGFILAVLRYMLSVSMWKSFIFRR